jgi:hypothetical protein
VSAERVVVAAANVLSSIIASIGTP